MYFRPISPQLLRRNFGRFAGNVAAGAGGRRRSKHTDKHVNCRHGKCCVRRPPRSPRTRAPKVSRLASSLSARHLETAFRAASGQRTRGRRPNPHGRKLLLILIKLVCEGRAVEAAAGLPSKSRRREHAVRGRKTAAQRDVSHGVRACRGAGRAQMERDGCALVMEAVRELTGQRCLRVEVERWN